jgi:alpha-beta hydrolase superfamily lysophospholipase
MKHQSDMLKTPDGTTLFTQSWLPEPSKAGAALTTSSASNTPTTAGRGVIVIVHGLAEHSGRYSHVADYFTNAGYIVTALDHRGHGRSQGQQLGYFERFQGLVDDLHLFIKNLPSAWRAAPLYVLGHSMGGLLTLCYLIRYAPPVSGVVLSGAALDIGENVPAVARGLIRQLASIAPKMGLAGIDSTAISRDPQVVKAYDGDAYVFRGRVKARVAMELRDACVFARQNLAKINRPMLIMHGSADRIVGPACADDIYADISSADKTLKRYEGLYHELYNEPEKLTVLNDVRLWLAAH